jgi:thiol-disulfide isomerase/thioredoxin
MRDRNILQLVALLSLTAIVFSCSGGSDDPVVGNLDDFSYMARRGVPYGPTATGESLDLAAFKGKYVWVDYSAPWCGPCVSQAPTIRQLEHAYEGKVVFLTVLVSDSSPRNPATRNTARVWAAQHKLDEAHVAAGQERVRYIPTHILFSPMGQTLFRKSGVFSEGQIRSTIEGQMRVYAGWYDDNKDNLSVMLGEIGDLGE